MTIGERIRLARQNKKMNQQELSDKSGVAYKSLSRYELGATIPPADALKAIADALGVSADALLNDENIQIKDTELLKKFQVIQDMNDKTKDVVTTFLDLVIRDFKARQAYNNK